MINRRNRSRVERRIKMKRIIIITRRSSPQKKWYTSWFPR
jgi:hypothetical protein